MDEPGEVSIELESEVDTYLYLRAGEARSGAFLHENDDIESGNTDSRIVAALEAGTYTLEATTFHTNRTGSFTLTASGLGTAGARPGPDATISVTPGSGPPGSLATLTGEGFKAFVPVQSVTVGPVEVTPAPRPNSDANGTFSFDIIIPGLDVGIQTIEVRAGDTTASTGFTVTEPGTPGLGGCGDSLTGDGPVSGRWEPGCESQERDGFYARYYSFSLDQESGVTIDLDSDVDTYLYLREGDARSGPALHENDDIESGNTNSRIVATLTAGTYTIEASTYRAGTTGSFTLTISGLGQGPSEPPMVLLGTASVDGSPVPAGTLITAWDGDRQIGSTQAREGGGYALLITRTVGPITFKLGSLVADQTYAEWVSGQITPGFHLTAADTCGHLLDGNQAITGQWTPVCQSEVEGRGYAQYYTFSLSQQSQVTIDLQSSVDTYLYLRQGDARIGDFLHDNDDVEPGVNVNSRINESLEAGSYTIEATTFNPEMAGSFTLTISGLSGVATSSEAGPDPVPGSAA